MAALYAITDSTLLTPAHLLSAVEAALQGGCTWIQYRDKSSNHQQRLAEAIALRELCERYDAALIVNDDLPLAVAAGAHGVHLGQGDGDPREARATLGTNAIVGVTCHDSLELAQQAVDAGATYIAFGRFFSSSTKPDARPAPLSLISDARARFPSTPIAVIGGITLDNVSPLIHAGADYIAVCHSLFSANDITGRTQQFHQLLIHP
jgi:thiamine-phosphate pyrophosphorylase